MPRSFRRKFATASALTATACMAATLGMGTASAADSTSWVLDGTRMSHSISGNLAAGETITSYTSYERSSAAERLLESAGVTHNPCLEYVDDSATVNGMPQTAVSKTETTVQVNGNWNLMEDRVEARGMKNIVAAFSFVVGENCSLSSSLKFRLFQTIDGRPSGHSEDIPVIKENKAASSATVAVAPAPKAAAASTLTATVDPTDATGKVEFFNNGDSIGIGAIENGAATISWTPGAGAAGQNYSITATYLGDAAYLGSFSDPQTGAVGAADKPSPAGSLGSLSGIFGSLG